MCASVAMTGAFLLRSRFPSKEGLKPVETQGWKPKGEELRSRFPSKEGLKLDRVETKAIRVVVLEAVFHQKKD